MELISPVSEPLYKQNYNSYVRKYFEMKKGIDIKNYFFLFICCFNKIMSSVLLQPAKWILLLRL